MKYSAIYNTSAEISVVIEVPEDVIARLEGDEWAIEEWVAEKSHQIAEEHIQSWGIHAPVLLGMTIDGIGAETIERIDA